MFEKFNALVNEPMSAHTTLKLGGPADYMVFPGSEEEIAELYAEARANDVPVTVIGHGSNLLVLDGGIRGLVICIGKNMRQITRERNIIRAQAGAMLGSVAMEAAEAGLQGLEFASGIPGTVGGGVTMNAGAYCGEIVQERPGNLSGRNQNLPDPGRNGLRIPSFCCHGKRLYCDGSHL